MARDSAAAAAIPFGRREVLGPHPLDEIVVRGGLDDLVELRAVVGDQAHTFDDDVVDAPAVLLARQPVVHRHLVTLLGDDARLHRPKGIAAAAAESRAIAHALRRSVVNPRRRGIDAVERQWYLSR